MSLLTVEQIIRYHMVLQAVYLVITNGVHTWCSLYRPEKENGSLWGRYRGMEITG